LDQYILEMEGITKTFPGVKALDRVSFKVKKGEVHALVGENGAGKSTLMKVLNGIHPPDEGTIKVDGRQVKFKDTNAAKESGISLIYQEFNLINNLSVAENIYLGKLRTNKIRAVDWKALRNEANELINKLGFHFSVKEKVKDLSVAERQLVEIAKALSVNAKIIAMDEPTSALTRKETERLFEIIDDLKRGGITVIYISHKLEEVFAICDTVTVLRDGQIIDTKPITDTNRAEVISKMVGRSVDMNFPKRDTKPGEVVLSVKGITRKGLVEDISFELRKGEILGIAGLVGAGRTELVEAVFGAARRDAGEIYVNGKLAKINSTTQGKKYSIGLVTEDRKETGLALTYSVSSNILMANIDKVLKHGVVNRKLERDNAQKYVEELNIKTPSIQQTVFNLSGGNQQKVVLAKWLSANVDILILDEPTRGIDVGAKYEIYLLMNKLVAEGKAIIMISSELPEVLGMSDRVMVMSEGRKKGELQGDEINSETVMHMALS
jgi:ABC-type sugar transport system ATPase subunit